MSFIELHLLVRLEVLPLQVTDTHIVVAMADPLDKATIRQLEFFTGKKVSPVISTFSQIYLGLRKIIPDFSPVFSPLENLLSNHATNASNRIRLKRSLNTASIRKMFGEQTKNIDAIPERNVRPKGASAASKALEDEDVQDLGEVDLGGGGDELVAEASESEDDLSLADLSALDGDETSIAGALLADDVPLGDDSDLEDLGADMGSAAAAPTPSLDDELFGAAIDDAGVEGLDDVGAGDAALSGITDDFALDAASAKPESEESFPDGEDLGIDLGDLSDLGLSDTSRGGGGLDDDGLSGDASLEGLSLDSGPDDLGILTAEPEGTEPMAIESDFDGSTDSSEDLGIGPDLGLDDLMGEEKAGSDSFPDADLGDLKVEASGGDWLGEMDSMTLLTPAHLDADSALEADPLADSEEPADLTSDAAADLDGGFDGGFGASDPLGDLALIQPLMEGPSEASNGADFGADLMAEGGDDDFAATAIDPPADADFVVEEADAGALSESMAGLDFDEVDGDFAEGPKDGSQGEAPPDPSFGALETGLLEDPPLGLSGESPWVAVQPSGADRQMVALNEGMIGLSMASSINDALDAAMEAFGPAITHGVIYAADKALVPILAWELSASGKLEKVPSVKLGHFQSAPVTKLATRLKAGTWSEARPPPEAPFKSWFAGAHTFVGAKAEFDGRGLVLLGCCDSRAFVNLGYQETALAFLQALVRKR
jgi:hypothetical protein